MSRGNVKNRRAGGKQKRAPRPLSERFKGHQPLGGSVAEREAHLAEYYTEKDRYVGRIAQGLPDFFILLGDKGGRKVCHTRNACI